MDIPPAAVEALLAVDTCEFPGTDGPPRPVDNYLTREAAGRALAAAVPHLLPGLYVTTDPDAVVWAEDPARPAFPRPVLARTAANAVLFDALAALLPDRTDQEDDPDEGEGGERTPGNCDDENCVDCDPDWQVDR